VACGAVTPASAGVAGDDDERERGDESAAASPRRAK
jgi:hypothetical protein